jgi:flagellar export protein FliJ
MALSHSRLVLLRRIAENKESEAGLALAEAQRRLAAQRATETELRGYLAEYEQRPLRAATPALLENQRQFLERLRAAVDAQQQQVAAAAIKVEQLRQHWVEQRQGLKVAESMLEQGLQVERRSEARRSQTEMDEFSITRRPPAVYAH